jgi:hypothetical protein
MAAADPRHAAWQTKTRFAVRSLSESGAETELAAGLPDLVEATEFAVRWLDRVDPARTGVARLVIVRADEAGEATVWAYPPPPPAEGRDLTELFGFDPTTWRPQIPSHSRREERALTLSGRSRASAQVEVPARAPRPPARERAGAADEPAVTTLGPVAGDEPSDPRRSSALARSAELRRAAAAFAGASWDDLLSRVLLIVAAFSLWLCLALLDPWFAVLTVATVSALWLRQRQRRSAHADDEFSY